MAGVILGLLSRVIGPLKGVLGWLVSLVLDKVIRRVVQSVDNWWKDRQRAEQDGRDVQRHNENVQAGEATSREERRNGAGNVLND